MSEESIKDDLENFIKKCVGPTKEVINTHIENLTAPGDNYWSTMLKIDITLRNKENNKEEQLHAVAKTINPGGSELFKEHVMPQFKNEITFYTEIVPTLQEFQREQGVTEVLNLFPKVYGTRKNISGIGDEMDGSSIIVFENLKAQGFGNIDRIIGFDLEGAKAMLKDLAVFHAVPIALKLKNPNVFATKVRKHLDNPLTVDDIDALEPLLLPDWFEYIQRDERCKAYYERVKILWEANLSKDEFTDRPRDEPYASILHGDMWCNNTMQKSTKNRFVDFQMYTYGSPICDLIFFIFSSIQYSLVKIHFDEFIKLYHRHFYNTLEQLGCDTTPFEYSKFLERLNKEAPTEFLHLLYMSIPIHGRKGESVLTPGEETWHSMLRAEFVTKEAKEKIANIIYEFGSRGWIK